VEDIRGLPVSGIVSGISETLAKGGYKTILYDLHLLEKLYNQYEQIGTYRQRINEGLNFLQSSDVDGIIYVAMHDRHLDYLFDPMDTPLVFAYSHGTETDTYVTYSNRDSAADMIRYLLNKGHERIAVIAGHPHSYPTAQPLLGVQMALQQAGLALPQEYIQYGNWEYESGKEQTRKLLKLDPLPTAIFAMNDLMAAGCMAELMSAGLRIPDDMAVAGFDNREIAAYLQPSLTTVALPTTEIGTEAALRIIDMISNPSPHPVRKIIRCSIIERNSV
jgi:LacI family transcriptional regulator